MSIRMTRISEKPGQPLAPLVAPVRPRITASSLRRKKLRRRRGNFLTRVYGKHHRQGFGRHFRHESGHQTAGDHTWYYHATKGWRRRFTASAAQIMGAHMGNWMMLRLDLIEATERLNRFVAKHEATGFRKLLGPDAVERRLREKVDKIKAEFKRTCELP